MAERSRGITDRPALLLVKLGNEIAQQAEDPLAAMGLSGRQYMVLAVLSADTPPSQLELAGLCGLLPAQVVPVIDELERRGFVARQRSETDRRRSVVSLTHAGSEILERADELGRSLVDGIEPAVREVLVEALLRSYSRTCGRRASRSDARPGVAEGGVAGRTAGARAARQATAAAWR